DGVERRRSLVDKPDRQRLQVRLDSFKLAVQDELLRFRHWHARDDRDRPRQLSESVRVRREVESGRPRLERVRQHRDALAGAWPSTDQDQLPAAERDAQLLKTLPDRGQWLARAPASTVGLDR